MIRCQLQQNVGIHPDAWPSYVRQVRQSCQCGICENYRQYSREPHIYTPAHDPRPPGLFPMMTIPAQSVEKRNADILRPLLERTLAILRNRGKTDG